MIGLTLQNTACAVRSRENAFEKFEVNIDRQKDPLSTILIKRVLENMISKRKRSKQNWVNTK